MISGRDDSDLTVRLRRRDPEALGLLYDRYGKAAYSLALRIVGNAEWAESIVAEAMIKCWNKIASFKESRGAALGVWLMVTVYANALDHRRSVNAKVAERPGETGMLERHALYHDWAKRLDPERVQDAFGSLRDLDSDETHILELAFFEGLTPAELTTHLGRTQTEVDQIVNSALAKLFPFRDS